MTSLPFDIVACIVEEVAASDESLSALAQSCTALLPLCRAHIFASVDLSHTLPFHFAHILSQPIAQYIRHIDYNPRHYTIIDDQRALDTLCTHATCLTSVRLSTNSWNLCWSWSDLPSSIHSRVLSLLRLPTITALDIEGFRNFPTSALFHCTNLRSLGLSNIESFATTTAAFDGKARVPMPTSLVAEDTISPNALAHILQVQMPCVDLSLLQTARFDVTPATMIAVEQLVKRTTQLESISISSASQMLNTHSYLLPTAALWPQSLAGLAASINIRSFHTLTSASLQIFLKIQEPDYYNVTPAYGIRELSNDLRVLSNNNNSVLQEFNLTVDHPNVLQELYITIDESMMRIYKYDDLPFPFSGSDAWSDFDNLLAGQEVHFPLLRRVSIKFQWPSSSKLRSAVMIQGLRSAVTKEHFPRLASTAHIAFELSAEEYPDGGQ